MNLWFSCASGSSKGAETMYYHKLVNHRLGLCIFFSETLMLTQCLAIAECLGIPNKRWKYELLLKTSFTLSTCQSPHQLHSSVPSLREEMNCVNQRAESRFWSLLSLGLLPFSILSFFFFFPSSGDIFQNYMILDMREMSNKAKIVAESF